MFIRIRKEATGYYLFDRDSRAQKFVESDVLDLHNVSSAEVVSFVQRYFPEMTKRDRFELLQIKNQDLELSAPIGMYLEISRDCNLHCRHCYKHVPRIHTNPTLDDFKKLLDELSSIGVFEIRICGNEPTASPFLGEFVGYAKSLNFFVGVNTNCYFGEEGRESLLGMSPDYVVVSLDGDHTTHDSIRIPGSYDRVLEMLGYLSAHKVQHRINTVVSKKTLGLVSHVAGVASRYGSGVSYIPFRPIGKNAQFNEQNRLTSDHMRSVVEEIEVLRTVYPGMVLLTYFDVLGCNSIHHHSMQFNAPCPARKNGFISYSGDFFPCDFLRFAEDAYFCGNVFMNTFEDIWRNSSALKRFQGLQHGKCKKCDHFMTKCHGGCVSASLLSTGKAEDELCFVRIDSKR